MAEFTHLHVHTEYSLLDGMTTPEELADIVSTNGQVASAITDHGTMGGYLRFQKAAKKQGIKPIFGVEAYFVDDVTKDDQAEKVERFHLILLAKNDQGLENLFKINKAAWTDNHYYKPRTDFQLLEAHSEGIICLSGCMGSAVSKAIMDEDDERIDYLINKFKGMYGTDYYLEVQPHNPTQLNDGLIAASEEYGLPIVGTLDCHFPTQDDWGFEEVLLMCGQKSSMSAPQNRHAKDHQHEAKCEHDLIKKMDIMYPDRRLSFKDLPLYVMGAEEARQHFVDAGYGRTDILENTMEIAEKCNAEIKVTSLYLPSYAKEAKIKMESNEYLRDISHFMLKEKGLANQQYIDRLNEELDVITSKNFSDYFLILWDLATWADGAGIARGPARGSSAGSLLAYILDITKVDPIKHGLLFFRFLNPERNDFPDIDMDFEDRRRDEAKEYLRQRWGEDRVAGVATYGSFQAKAAVKAIASVLEVPYQEANKMTSLFDDLDEYESSEALAQFRKEYPEISKIARKFHGRYKSAGAHAAGIVVSSVPLDTIVPIEVRKEANSDRKIQVIAYDKDEVAEMNLIKLDPLSLKAVTVISDCLKKIKEVHGVDVETESLDIDNPDPRVFEEFTAGNVVGIFQAEGAGYAELINKMGIIRDFNDLVASNALVRPGSFETQGATYLAVRDGRQAPQYDHDILKDILEESYGTYIYEEQVMMIAVELAGFSWGKADKLRKIISKKKDPVEFKAYERDFIDGASRYISEAKAKQLWNNIEKASSYMFNKSHALSYSWLSYQTMWLKVNYPIEFMWATLYNEDKPESMMTYIFEAIRLGIQIEGPDVNKSDVSFSVDGDMIRFGIGNVAGCGPSAVADILAKRPYVSFEEFTQKVAKNKVKKNVLEALEKVGFFESLGHAPYEKKRYYGPLLNYPIVSKSKYDALFTPCGEATESSNVYIIRGTVKETKRTPKYFRVEIEDASGTYSGFADRDAVINKRDYVVALVCDQGILYIEDFNEFDMSKSQLKKCLDDEVAQTGNPFENLYEKGLSPGLNDGEFSLVYYVGYRQFSTKSGTVMANVYFVIPEHGFEKVAVFGNQIDKMVAELDSGLEWKMAKFVKKSKGSGYYLNELVETAKFCRIRGIM